MSTAATATAAVYVPSGAVSVICRACNTNCITNEYRSLFKFGYILNEMTTLAQLLSFCADMKVIPEEDFLPGHICDECTQLLAQTYQFKKTILRTDQTLRKAHSAQKTLTQALIAGPEAVTVQSALDVASLKPKIRTTIVMPNLRATTSHSDSSATLYSIESKAEEEADSDNDENVGAKSAERTALIKKKTQATLTYDYMELYAVEPGEQEMLDLVCDNDIEVEEAEEIINTIDDDDAIAEEEQEQEGLDLSEIEENSNSYEMLKEEYVRNGDEDIGIDEENPEENNANENNEYCISEDSQYRETTQRSIVPTNVWQAIQQGDSDDGECNDNNDVHILKQRVKTRNIRVTDGRQTNPEYKCSVCMKQLSNGNSYRYHMQLHSDSTPFLCNLCGEGFKTRNAYDGHLTTHNPNNPNKCEQCGKSYRQASSLRVHMLTHSGEKPYQCEICGKGMTQKSGYKKHLLIHTGEKPHTCDICHRTFRYSSNLITHRRSHSVSKPFECSTCGKNFKSFSQLNRHKFMHTGVKSVIHE